MAKHQIKHHRNESILFECDVPDVPDDMAGWLRTRHALEKAMAAGANLTDANLTDANLTGAKWRNGIVINKPQIQLFGLHWSVTILDSHMKIGCELHALADWAAYDDKRIAEMDGREALRFWRAHKDVLLSLAASAGRYLAAVPDPSAS